MIEVLRRAVRIVLWPKEEWLVIGNEIPRPTRLLIEFVLPLSFIPAVCWSIGLAVFGGRGVVARDSAGLAVGEIAHGGLVAMLGSGVSVLLVAASLFVLAPLFGLFRDWPRALQVAAYSSAPVFLAGILLVMPDLVFALMLAAIHSFYLQYMGVQHILGAKTGDAAEYVALVCVLVIVASTILGAAASWIGAV